MAIFSCIQIIFGQSKGYGQLQMALFDPPGHIPQLDALVELRALLSASGRPVLHHSFRAQLPAQPATFRIKNV